MEAEPELNQNARGLNNGACMFMKNDKKLLMWGRTKKIFAYNLVLGRAKSWFYLYLQLSDLQVLYNFLNV